MINIADCTNDNDPQKRTYRQINADMVHSIPLQTLVELSNGVRLFVVAHASDCDQTPHYSLCADANDTVRHCAGFSNINWINGYTEDLKVIR